jgi:hypothetical protein
VNAYSLLLVPVDLRDVSKHMVRGLIRHLDALSLSEDSQLLRSRYFLILEPLGLIRKVEDASKPVILICKVKDHLILYSIYRKCLNLIQESKSKLQNVNELLSQFFLRVIPHIVFTL